MVSKWIAISIIILIIMMTKKCQIFLIYSILLLADSGSNMFFLQRAYFKVPEFMHHYNRKEKENREGRAQGIID